MLKKLFVASSFLAFGATAALAHATFEVQEAPVGANYKAVLRVPHGCDGKATKVVRVQIPEGVIAVKPMQTPVPPQSVPWLVGAVAPSIGPAVRSQVMPLATPGSTFACTIGLKVSCQTPSGVQG